MHFDPIAMTVRQFVSDNFVYDGRTEPISESESFLEGGLLDSTGVLELVTFLEGTFSIRIADEEVLPENLDSISRIAAFVRRKVAGAVEGEAISHAQREDR